VEDKSVAPATQDSMAPAQVTILANLPDSLQPETILLENTPAPKTIHIPDKPISFTVNQKSGTHILSIEPTKKIKASFSPVMKNYTAEQGLAQDVTSYSITDHKGNLWFGTHVGGISKYDGHSFTNYTTSHGLIENRINSMMEDRAGNIWVATNSGASKFDGTTFSTSGKFKDVRSILEDSNGNLWFATWNGLYKYAGDSITRYSQLDGLSVNKVTALKEDKKGILWIGTDNGLFTFDGKRFTHIALSNKIVYTICIDKSGNTWAGTPEGYIKYDGANITNYPFTNAYIRFAYEDRLGNIWLAGVLQFLSYPSSLYWY